MDNVRAKRETFDVVRAHRFELVDHRQRVRAILETGTGDEGSIEAGLRILDRLGHERILVAQMTWGAVVSISHEGETIAQIECLDDLPGSDNPGAQFELCAAHSERVLRWKVGLDGKVIEQRPPLPTSGQTAPDQ